jgi:hypothetical protein
MSEFVTSSHCTAEIIMATALFMWKRFSVDEVGDLKREYQECSAFEGLLSDAGTT